MFETINDMYPGFIKGKSTADEWKRDKCGALTSQCSIRSNGDVMLTSYNLDGETNKLVKDLSLGMKKKVALICALAVQPSVLILDEPTGGLDSDAQAELAEMLTQFISPSTMVICSTHDQTFLDSLPACRVISFPLEV